MHGYYIGYKFQRGLEQVDQARRDEIKDYTFSLLYELYDNETHYTQSLYDSVGLSEDVKKFPLQRQQGADEPRLRGDVPGVGDEREPGDPVGPVAQRRREPRLSSRVGSSYVIGKAEATEDDDWDF